MPTIRLANPSDSENLLKIYAPYIENTAISFETHVPSVLEFASRIEAITSHYPFLVYEKNGSIVGYAYASQHMERAAYAYDVDVSIYVLPAFHGEGIARKLYQCLFALLKTLGYYNAYALCTLPNEKSEKFHQKLGFTLIGVHHKTGYKLNRWHDVAWFEKSISDDPPHPGAIKSIHELPADELHKLFRNILNAPS